VNQRRSRNLCYWKCETIWHIFRCVAKDRRSNCCIPHSYSSCYNERDQISQQWTNLDRRYLQHSSCDLGPGNPDQIPSITVLRPFRSGIGDIHAEIRLLHPACLTFSPMHVTSSVVNALVSLHTSRTSPSSPLHLLDSLHLCTSCTSCTSCSYFTYFPAARKTVVSLGPPVSYQQLYIAGISPFVIALMTFNSSSDIR
jgi:hypothetical protein